MKNNITIYILSTLILCIGISGNLIAGENSVKLNYYGEIDRKLKVFIAGGNVDFNKEFEASDKKGLIDHKNKPDIMADADLVVILLSDWKNAEFLGDDLGFLKSKIQKVPDDNIDLFLSYNVKDNQKNMERVLSFHIYNFSSISSKPFRCITDDIINNLTLNTVEKNKNNIVHCN